MNEIMINNEVAVKIIEASEDLKSMVAVLNELHEVKSGLRQVTHQLSELQGNIKADMPEIVRELVRDSIGNVGEYVRTGHAKKLDYTSFIDDSLRLGGVEEWEIKEARELVKSTFLLGLNGKKWQDVPIEILQENQDKLREILMFVINLRSRNKQLTLNDINPDETFRG